MSIEIFLVNKKTFIFDYNPKFLRQFKISSANNKLRQAL